jgi:hypothetical protein
MLLLLSLCLFSQQTESPPAAMPREVVAAFEAQKFALEKQKAALEQQIRELDLKMQKGDFALDKRVEQWDQIKNLLPWVGVIGLFGLLSLLFSNYKFIEAIMRSQIKDKADEIFAVVDERAQEKRILANTRILLINEDESLESISWLFKWGFHKVDRTTLAKFRSDPNRDEYDLILFDRLKSEPINEVMKNLPSQFCIGYGKPGLKLEYQERINMANSPITLFSRIMETEKYRQNIQKT